jgi:hypothetical protein
MLAQPHVPRLFRPLSLSFWANDVGPGNAAASGSTGELWEMEMESYSRRHQYQHARTRDNHERSHINNIVSAYPIRGRSSSVDSCSSRASRKTVVEKGKADALWREFWD